MTDQRAHKGAGAANVPEGALHLKAADQIIRYDVLPGGDVEGTRRGVANGIATTSTMVNVLEMPPGQSSPKRQFTGDHTIFQHDAGFRDRLMFFEYFHADTGEGLGASHQTGWTALVGDLILRLGRRDRHHGGSHSE